MAFFVYFCTLIFLAAVTVTALLIRQKRYRLLWVSLPVMFAAFFMEQCFDMAVMGYTYSQTAAEILAGFTALPDWLLLVFCVVPALSQVMLM